MFHSAFKTDIHNYICEKLNCYTSSSRVYRVSHCNSCQINNVNYYLKLQDTFLTLRHKFVPLSVKKSGRCTQTHSQKYTHACRHTQQRYAWTCAQTMYMLSSSRKCADRMHTWAHERTVAQMHAYTRKRTYACTSTHARSHRRPAIISVNFSNL